MPNYTVVEVETRRDLMRFIKFPDKLYRNCPQYLPALHSDQVKSLTKVSTLSYCKRKMWMVMDGKKVAGRICGMINPRYNERYGKKRARFGWFDTIDDFRVAELLVHTAEDWARENGMNEIHGPLYYNTLGKQGMLVEGFEEEGTLITFYNHEYYKHHLEALGYRKCTDWLERRITIPEKLDEKYLKLARIVAERNKIHVVRYTRKEIKRMDIGQKLFDLVNRTYCKLYGYSILSKKQIDQYVKLYLSLVDLRYVSFVNDENDNLVAFGVMLPSMNEALRKSGGRYLPFGWWHLLKALYFSKADTIEMLLIAVEPSLQSKGVPAMLITDLFSRVVEGGFKYAETNPELEDNYAVANLWNGFDLRQHRRRRVYGKAIEL